MDKEMNLLTLRAEARYLCEKCGMRMPEDEALRALFTDEIPQPIIIRSEGATVWIDRYYAAYETKEGLTYDYLTEFHVREEKEAWGTLPREVEEAFARHEGKKTEA